MKILILTPIWKRPEVVKIWYDKILELNNHTRHHVGVLAITSPEDPHIKEFRSLFGWGQIYEVNSPLGKKKNTGLDWAMTMEWDYLLELGSDDILHPDFFKHPEIKKCIDKREPMFGMNNLYVCEPKTQRCLWVGGNWNDGMAFGAGRMIHRSVIEKTLYRMGALWPPVESGLDTESRKRINAAYGRTTSDPLEKVIDVGDKPLVLSIKTDTNLWPIWWHDQWREKHPDNYKDVDCEKIYKEFGVWESVKNLR